MPYSGGASPLSCASSWSARTLAWFSPRMARNIESMMKTATKRYERKRMTFMYPPELSMISSISKSPNNARANAMIAGKKPMYDCMTGPSCTKSIIAKAIIEMMNTTPKKTRSMTAFFKTAVAKPILGTSTDANLRILKSCMHAHNE